MQNPWGLEVPTHLPAVGPELMLALDVDGTIVTHAGECRDEVYHSVRRVVDAGAQVVIATGRGPQSAAPVLELLGLPHGFAVCSNGAITVRGKPGAPAGIEIMDVVTFPPEATLRRLRQLLPESIFMVEDGHAVRRVSAPFPAGEVAGDPEVVDFEELCAHPASRVTLRAPDLDAKGIHGVLAEANLHGVSYAVGWTAWVDISPQGVSKATGLERVREHMRISPFYTVAVGDGHNDHEMLAWASWSVAMGQARPETRAFANAVAPPVEEDGLAWVLHALAQPR